MATFEVPLDVKAAFDNPVLMAAFEHPAYWQCVSAALDSYDLVEQFDRICRTNLLGRGAPIELLIDAGTGRLERDVLLFLEFVHDAIYSRLPASIWDTPGIEVRGVRV